MGLCSLFRLLVSGFSLFFALSAGSRYGSYYQRKARTSYFLERPAPSEWGQGWGLQPAWVSRGNHGLPGTLQGQALRCGLLTVTVSSVIDPWAGVRPASLTQPGLVLQADCALGQHTHLESVLGAKAGNASGLLSESQFPLSGTPELGPTYLEACPPSPSSGGGVGESRERGEGRAGDKAASPGLKVTGVRPPARRAWRLGTPAGWYLRRDAQKSAWLSPSLLPPNFLSPAPLKPNQAGDKAKHRNHEANDSSPHQS